MTIDDRIAALGVALTSQNIAGRRPESAQLHAANEVGEKIRALLPASEIRERQLSERSVTGLLLCALAGLLP